MASIKDINIEIKARQEMYSELHGFRIQFKNIIGTINGIRVVEKETLYADNEPYKSINIYELDILTDDMYTITINPIAQGTINEIIRAKGIIENYNLNNSFKI